MKRAQLLGPVLALALLPSNVVAAALPLIRAEWQASATAAGWVFAAYQVGYVVSVLVLLPLTDRVRAGLVIAGCALITAISCILFPLLATNVWNAAALRFLAGLGLAGIYLPGVRIVAAAATAERRGLMVGIYVSAFYLGSALSLWATGLLLPGLGWRGAALVLGLVALLAFPLALVATTGVQAPERGQARLDLRVLRNGPVTRTILAYTGHSWELYVSRGWLAAFIAAVLVSRGSEPVAASAAGSQWAALMAGLGAPGVFLGGWLSDRIGRPRAALLIILLSGSCSLGFGFLGAGPWALLVVIGCLYGLLISADSAIFSTAITEYAPPERLGSAQALQAFIGFSSTIAAPVAAGILLDLGLGWGLVFALAGIVGIGLGLPLLALIPRLASDPATGKLVE